MTAHRGEPEFGRTCPPLRDPVSSRTVPLFRTLHWRSNCAYQTLGQEGTMGYISQAVWPMPTTAFTDRHTPSAP